MIKEIKNLKYTKTKKLKKYKRKHYKQQRLTKRRSHSQNQSQSHIQKQEISKSASTIDSESKQKGGNVKEKFEVKRLADIDYSQFSLSKYINANTNWGSSPGPPPMDCTIM